jgi:hypothetical protein
LDRNSVDLYWSDPVEVPEDPRPRVASPDSSLSAHAMVLL